ncbi:hypothetical protein LCGC14_2588080 [marine sediment metagenome]|uniref:Uncharacterized protein n=1 Tax=marine sediment metagenome TaxID=412755 RepID=A0A0F9ACF8_9ZZZZ
MKASKVRKRLKELIKEYGDLPTYYLDPEDKDREAEVVAIGFTTTTEPQFYIV